MSEELRIAAFFAPVDDKSTKVYVIAYLRASGAKPIDSLLAKTEGWSQANSEMWSVIGSCMLTCPS